MRDKVPKALKDAGGKGKKKKWSKTKSKDKVDKAVFWTKNLHDKLIKDVVAKESYLTPSLISEKLKINVSLARQAIRSLREDNQIAPVSEYHHKYCCFTKTANFVPPVVEKKEATAKGGKKQQ